MIRAVLFDLDDTLYLQRHWLEGAWAAVADAAMRQGLDGYTFHAALVRIAAEGSDKGRIIDRALEAIQAVGVDVPALVATFLSHRPTRLACYPGAAPALLRLRMQVRLGMVTDGAVDVQQSKLEALGLASAFDVIVYSDVLGREMRKPHPAPMRLALEELGVPADEAVFVGDRPDKDVAGAAAMGMRAIRVRTGEYANRPDQIDPWATAPDVVGAVALIEEALSREPCPTR